MACRQPSFSGSDSSGFEELWQNNPRRTRRAAAFLREIVQIAPEPVTTQSPSLPDANSPEIKKATRKRRKVTPLSSTSCSESEPPPCKRTAPEPESQTSGFCYQQTAKALSEACVIGKGISVRQSPLGCLGLFVDRPFAKDEYITKMDGVHERVTPERLQEIKNDPVLWDHLLMLTKDEVIHGIYEFRDGDGGGSFANDGGVSRLSCANTDYILLEDLNEIYLRAKRPLKAGEEVLVTYGPRHWAMAKQRNPTLYKAVMEQQVRTHSQIKKAFETYPQSGMFKVLKTFEGTPVPVMPEMKGRQQTTWTNQALRYAMFSRGVDSSYLNVATLKSLKTSTDEYYRAVRQYVIGLKGNLSGVVRDWNHTGLKVPQCGVFAKTAKWSAGHLNFMLWQAGDNRFCRKKDSITFTLNTLNPECPDYCALIMERVLCSFNLPPGGGIDLNDQNTYSTMELLLSNLRLSKVPLPPRLGQRSFLYKSWTHAAMKQLLTHFGYTVVDRRITAESKLVEQMAEVVGDETRSEDYYDLLKRKCEQGDFNYARILQKAKSPEKGIERLPLQSEEGLDLSSCDSAALLLVCLVHFGVTSKTLKHATTAMTMNALTKITDRTLHGKTYSNTLAALSNSYQHEDSMLLALKKHRLESPNDREFSRESIRTLRKQSELSVGKLKKAGIHKQESGK